MKTLFFKASLLIAAFVCTLADEAAEAPTLTTASVLNPDYSTEDRTKMKEAGETHEFQAEVSRLMDIIINSLYTQKEVFLRELISNSADALEKTRYISVTDKSILEAAPDLEVRIAFDADEKTLSIIDTGVGMNKDDLINNLGTVAKSGTTNFLEAMAGDADLSLIGQFGVGFYSTYLVADRVTVTSKKADDDQWVWESSADSSFNITKDPRGNSMGRGTKVTLHMKEDATEFLSEYKLRDLAKNFSQFINFPIYLRVSKTVDEEVPLSAEELAAQQEEEAKEKAEKAEKEAKEADVEVEEKDEEEEDKKEKKTTKTVKKDVFEWELVNTQKALWLRSKDDVTDEEYSQFYKSLTKDYNDPLGHIHFAAEGQIEFNSILYIPEKAPHDMIDNYFNKQSQLKLYVRRVLVADQFEDLMPRYLHFVRGVVDSDDLPLNVSREQLQQHKIMKVISERLVRKALELLKKLAKDEADELKDEKVDEDDEEKKDKKPAHGKFTKFYKEFSRNMKLGCYEDDKNRSKIAKLLRFKSSKSSELLSLDDYISRMQEGQESIYYISGEDERTLAKNPNMQIFEHKGIEVIYLTDTMDEPCIQRLSDFDGKKFISIQKGDIKLDESELSKKRDKKLKTIYEPLMKWLKDTLSGKVNKVEVSKRLVADPCGIVSSQWGYSPYMERIMKAQAFANKEEVNMMGSQKTLEINPNHPVVIKLSETVRENPEDPEAKKQAYLLFHSAMISSGYDVNDPTVFAKEIYSLVGKEMGVVADGPFPDLDVGDLEEEEEVVDEDILNIDDFDVDEMVEKKEDEDLLNVDDVDVDEMVEKKEDEDLDEDTPTPHEHEEL